MVKTLAVIAAVGTVLGLAAWPKLTQYHVDIPDFQRPAKTVLLEQNWSPAQRAALDFVMQAIAKRYFEENKVPEATRLAWAGNRAPRRFGMIWSTKPGR